ncbi:unnamed protein product [Rotaria sordida]|uniref:Phosphoglycerate mutase n=2 Tax=Rotaria sordida TaxID=392033 RepID=A0A813SAQ3_9BILA|nr:unnamed protein product [Rotaria sordida]CAF0793601.1 unnamed protein product [Rotaria sordida]CAF0974242.1 unnamed protein product [Rotaria sordida]
MIELPRFETNNLQKNSTAHEIHRLIRVLSCEIKFDSLLYERRFGNAQGQRCQWLRELTKENGVPYINFTPSGAETNTQVREHVIKIFQKLCQEIFIKFCLKYFPYGNHFSDLDVFIVSHGCIIRELIKYFAYALQTDIGQYLDTIQELIPNTSITRIEVTYSTNEQLIPTITLVLIDYHNKTHLINTNNEEFNLDTTNKYSLQLYKLFIFDIHIYHNNRYILIIMLFFRRRDTLSQSNLTDQERCIHACLFFAFIFVILTAVLFYFATTSKGTEEPRTYYYLGAGICLGFLLLIILCTIIYVRRFYGVSVSSTHHQGITSELEHDNSKYSNNDV